MLRYTISLAVTLVCLAIRSEAACPWNPGSSINKDCYLTENGLQTNFTDPPHGCNCNAMSFSAAETEHVPAAFLTTATNKACAQLGGRDCSSSTPDANFLYQEGPAYRGDQSTWHQMSDCRSMVVSLSWNHDANQS